MQQSILYMSSGACGALLTFFLQKQGLPVVLSASIVGILGVAVEYFFKIPSLSLLVFAGAFAGMTSPDRGTYYHLFLAGLLVGIIFILTPMILKGFGGKLGAIALISIVTVYFIDKIIRNFLNL